MSSATGEPLAFFRLDLIWVKPWQSRMPKLVALLRSKGIPLQVIYDGSSIAGCDAVWVSQAKQRFQEFESNHWIGVAPCQSSNAIRSVILTATTSNGPVIMATK
jgi:hypothetical protein